MNPDEMPKAPEEAQKAEPPKAQPIAGYRQLDPKTAGRVNLNKILEEKILRLLDQLKALPEVDGRWLQVGRTHIEQGWMAINRAITKPERLTLE